MPRGITLIVRPPAWTRLMCRPSWKYRQQLPDIEPTFMLHATVSAFLTLMVTESCPGGTTVLTPLTVTSKGACPRFGTSNFRPISNALTNTSVKYLGQYLYNCPTKTGQPSGVVQMQGCRDVFAQLVLLKRRRSRRRLRPGPQAKP